MYWAISIVLGPLPREKLGCRLCYVWEAPKLYPIRFRIDTGHWEPDCTSEIRCWLPGANNYDTPRTPGGKYHLYGLLCPPGGLVKPLQVYY